MLQAFLDYAGNLAIAIKNADFDDQDLRSTVRVVIPRGNVLVANQIVVPEWVELDCRGMLVRALGGSLSTNNYLPVIVFVPNSACARLRIYCEADSTHLGSGVCFGKTWTVTNLVTATAGTGYQVGDIIYLTSPSSAPFWRATATVTSIGAGGSVTGFTFTGGIYTRRPNSGPTVSASAITAVAPNVAPLVQPSTLVQTSTYHSNGTPGAGSGASFTPTWSPDFVAGDPSGVFTYQAGQVPASDMRIGDVVVGNVGMTFSPSYGACFGVYLNTFNAIIGSIEVSGGYYGIVASATDTRASSLNPVGSMIGMIVTGGSFECPNVVVDTTFLAGLVVWSTCGSINLKGTMIWPEGNNYLGRPNDSGYVIIVGTDAQSTADNIRLDFGLSNCGSATQNGATGIGALYIQNVQNSHFNIETSNKLTVLGGTHKIALHTGYGPNVDAQSVLVSGTIDGISGLVASAGAVIGSFTVSAGGSGYAVGDIVSATSTGRIISAIAQVTAVSSGVVTGVRFVGPGLYSTTPSTVTALATVAITGSGSGLTLLAGNVSSAATMGAGLSIRDGGMPGWVRDYGLCEITGNGAPSATTGQNKALKGSRYIDYSAGELYINKGTAGTLNWRKVTTA